MPGPGIEPTTSGMPSGRANHYTTCGIVPLEWKEANIIPSFKKGSRNKSVNDRPVSLTSVICKLLETFIRDHMMDFFIKHLYNKGET